MNVTASSRLPPNIVPIFTTWTLFGPRLLGVAATGLVVFLSVSGKYVEASCKIPIGNIALLQFIGCFGSMGRMLGSMWQWDITIYNAMNALGHCGNGGATMSLPFIPLQRVIVFKEMWVKDHFIHTWSYWWPRYAPALINVLWSFLL